MIVGQLLRRQPWAILSDFNDRIIAVNIRLIEQLSIMQGLHFCPHQGVLNDMTFHGHDVVHLQVRPNPVLCWILWYPYLSGFIKFVGYYSYM